MAKLITKDLSLKIRKLMLDGANIKTMREALDISEGTWDYWYWDNTEIGNTGQGFRDFVNKTKQERIVRRAESNLEVLLGSEDERVQADMTKFSLETIGKDMGYSKKTHTDLTSDGKPINVSFDPSLSSRHANSDTSTSEDSEEQ